MVGKSGSGRRVYKASSEEYNLLEEVGYGANAVVYRAIYIPSNEIVAVKCLDLDRCNSNLDDIRREAQIMKLIDHPNLIKAYCSFVVEQHLWVVMPFMSEGSCLHLMKIAYPDGFEERVISSILKETLKALEYLHRHGHIHRDIKAGNILIDSPGIVKLGDFGVSACMFDKGDRQRSRTTFVGTPCWMAPEVLQPGAGYDFKADIWSFGITALELAHGHAPFSKYPPMKVLLMTLQNAPPGLDYDRDKRFSKSFKEMVAMCLVKDPTKRPTAEKLLKHQFFKAVKSPEVALKKILADLPPLWDRVKALQLKDAAQLALRKMPSSEQEAISMSEYQRGVSAWNFDIEDLKAQASLIQDDDESSEIKEDEENAKGSMLEKVPSSSKCNSGKEVLEDETIYRGSSPVSDDSRSSSTRVEVPESSIASTSNNTRTDGREAKISENDLMIANEKKVVDSKPLRNVADAKKQAFSGPLILSDREKPSERSEAANMQQVASRPDTRRTTNFSGPLSLPNRASANSLSAPMRSPGGYMESMEEKSKRNVVQKGRFSVTSENVDLAKVPDIGIRKPTQGSSPLKKSASVGEWRYISKPVLAAQYSREISNSSLPSSAIVPHLQNLFQQTSFQQGLILNLLNTLQQNDRPDGAQAGISSQSHTVENDTVDSASSERERILLIKISELQAKMMALTDELIGAKLKHIQLEQELNALYSREEIETGNEEIEGA
ncbi:hypothetical protein LUZ61_019495 [Rhynchospora tenuis]|uniref:Protein kinase domain-containing protein n=1 Tax=Rhynchospora tenuis TaxID=198213 RepID=A0AAD6EN68_9POAL|nr:hypothetical protein LUZ61_019495 [Rhynchospora tenuis]